MAKAFDFKEILIKRNMVYLLHIHLISVTMDYMALTTSLENYSMKNSLLIYVASFGFSACFYTLISKDSIYYTLYAIFTLTLQMDLFLKLKVQEAKIDAMIII